MEAVSAVCKGFQINNKTQIHISLAVSAEGCSFEHDKRSLNKTDTLKNGPYSYLIGAQLGTSSLTVAVNVMVFITCITKELRTNGFFLLCATRSIADICFAANMLVGAVLFYTEKHLPYTNIYDCYVGQAFVNICYLWSVMILISITVNRYMMVTKPFAVHSGNQWKSNVKVRITSEMYYQTTNRHVRCSLCCKQCLG